MIIPLSTLTGLPKQETEDIITQARTEINIKINNRTIMSNPQIGTVQVRVALTISNDCRKKHFSSKETEEKRTKIYTGSLSKKPTTD